MLFIAFLKSKAGIITVGVLAFISAGLIIRSALQKPAYSFIEVEKSDIREEVIVTGKTVAVAKRDLAFERTGKVSLVLAEVGEMVHKGQLLVALDTAELRAKRVQAEANAVAEEAHLDELRRGARPESIAVAQAELSKVEQDLANEYARIPAVLNDAYAKADEAIRSQLDLLFAHPEWPTPELVFVATNGTAEKGAEDGRVRAGEALDAWKRDLTVLTSASPAALETALKGASVRLADMLVVLTHAMDAIVSSASASTTIYKAHVTDARNGINAALENVTDNERNISAHKAAVRQRRAELALDLAGAAPEDVRAQEAILAATRAEVAVISAQLAAAELRAPMDGTVTKQDANIGEIAPAQAALVTIIGKNAFEIEANIPETDSSKVKIGNPVGIAFDAFPGESFRGTVTKIDPAETVVDGVVNFKTTVAPESTDPRVKSGLTANLYIETARKEKVLVLPQAALIEKKQSMFVKKIEGGTLKEVPVKLGIRDPDGNVEILEGILEGDRILDAGRKANEI